MTLDNSNQTQRLSDFNPGFAWYMALGTRSNGYFVAFEFVKCGRGCGAAMRRCLAKHGEQAAYYYRPTSSGGSVKEAKGVLWK